MRSIRSVPERLRVQFVVSSLPIGGAETLLLNLIRRLNREEFSPEVVCLREPGALGGAIAREAPLHPHLIKSRWDTRILPRLAKLFRQREADVVITVGAGEKMFWGRLAAKWAGVPVVCSALHSTGWPDELGRLNRWLTPITDAFIAVARPHAEYLAEVEKLPHDRIFTIPNGVDVKRFQPHPASRDWLRNELRLPADCPVIGIVAGLRAEKNHHQFIDAAQEVHRHYPGAHFLIVGEGPERNLLEACIAASGLGRNIHLLGNRDDTERILAGLDVFCLTSRSEANPVSILEALACGVPVVAPKIGCIGETVIHRQTGLLTQALSSESTSDSILRLLGNPSFAAGMGRAGRQLVRGSWNLEAMVSGYEHLIKGLYRSKVNVGGLAPHEPALAPAAGRTLGRTPVVPSVEGALEPMGDVMAPRGLPVEMPATGNDFVSV